MKKYTNLIVLGVILLAAAVFLVYKNVNFNDLLLKVGYYDEKITIANTADVHGHLVFDDEVGTYYSIDQVSTIMGLPLMNHFIKKERSEDNILLFDSGDMFHGTNEANVEKGKGVVEAINLMGYNAMTPGNHDFNFGVDRLVEIKSQLNFPILSANIYRDGKLLFDEYKIFEVNGKKIGAFGLTTPSSLMYVKDSTVTFGDPEECTRRVVEALKGKVDVIVMISHLGDDVDKKIVEKVDGINLVMSGHYHLLYEKAVKVKDTYIVEAGGFTTHLGAADIYFKNGSLAKIAWRTMTTKDKSKADTDIKQVADKYYTEAMKSAEIKLGTAKVVLNGIRTQVRSRETNLGNMLADAMREAGNADLTLMNGGGIRESMPQGEVNMYKVGKVLPFVNSLVVVEMKGEKIYEAIERGLRSYPNVFNGGFLQVSGISYVIDGSKLAGERLVSVTKDGKPLEKDKIYKVATNDYLYAGGDGYEEIKEGKLVYAGGLLKDVMANYIKAKGEVEPKEDGRIKSINDKK